MLEFFRCFFGSLRSFSRILRLLWKSSPSKSLSPPPPDDGHVIGMLCLDRATTVGVGSAACQLAFGSVPCTDEVPSACDSETRCVGEQGRLFQMLSVNSYFDLLYRGRSAWPGSTPSARSYCTLSRSAGARMQAAQSYQLVGLRAFLDQTTHGDVSCHTAIA
eukprot:6247714-Amphidinium_carterae.2